MTSSVPGGTLSRKTPVIWSTSGALLVVPLTSPPCVFFLCHVFCSSSLQLKTPTKNLLRKKVKEGKKKTTKIKKLEKIKSPSKKRKNKIHFYFPPTLPPFPVVPLFFCLKTRLQIFFCCLFLYFFMFAFLYFFLFLLFVLFFFAIFF